MKATPPREPSEPARVLWQVWFGLTPNERLAVLIILALFLLGLGVRYGHLSHERGDTPCPAPTTPSPTM